MDVTQIAITAAVTSLVSGLVGAIVATLISMAKDKRRKDTSSDQAMREGMKLLLMDKAKGIVKDAVNDGEITIENRAMVHSLTRVARDLGANGESHELDRLADEIATKHER